MERQAATHGLLPDAHGVTEEFHDASGLRAMNAVLWIVAILVTEWALKTIWREYVVPRSHAKAATDRQDEAEGRAFFAQARSSVTLEIVPDTSRFDEAIARAQVAIERIERLENPLRAIEFRADQ